MSKLRKTLKILPWVGIWPCVQQQRQQPPQPQHPERSLKVVLSFWRTWRRWATWPCWRGWEETVQRKMVAFLMDLLGPGFSVEVCTWNRWGLTFLFVFHYCSFHCFSQNMVKITSLQNIKDFSLAIVHSSRTKLTAIKSSTVSKWLPSTTIKHPLYGSIQFTGVSNGMVEGADLINQGLACPAPPFPPMVWSEVKFVIPVTALGSVKFLARVV